jgi:hypothetical protein
MRRRAMSAGAAFSGSVAAACLWSALASGRPGPALGFAAGTIAAIALARAARLRTYGARLRLCPRRGVVLNEDGDGETPLLPIGVTPNLICLARAGGSAQRSSIWRDSLSPGGFRRIAAYALWRRNVVPDRAQGSELIARKTVTCPQSISRSGRPEGQ